MTIHETVCFSQNDKQKLPSIAYYGGTFDPIHLGHINICKNIAEYFTLKQITLLPNNIPPHRPQPMASNYHRIQMLKLLCQHDALFNIDLREFNKATYSYTIETLIDLRNEIGDEIPLLFIIGEDSLYTINKWHRWTELLNYTHLIICKRNITKMINKVDNELLEWIETHRTSDKKMLDRKSSGYLYIASTPYYEISATEIRKTIEDKKSVDKFLPSYINTYINEYNLYK